MVRKLGVLIAVLVVCGLLVSFIGTLEAAEVSGKGTLRAKGVGYVSLRGIGVASFKCYGAGRVVIKDADKVKVKILGVGRKVRRGNTIIVTGLKGRVILKGRLNVRFAGGKVYLKAVGKDRAVLKGKGRYRVNRGPWLRWRSEEHTSELQSHSFISYAVFCLKKKKNNKKQTDKC